MEEETRVSAFRKMNVIDDTLHDSLARMHGYRLVAIPALTTEEAEVLFRHHQGKAVLCQVRERSRSCSAAAVPVALLESCSILPLLPEFHAPGSLPSFKQIL